VTDTGWGGQFIAPAQRLAVLDKDGLDAPSLWESAGMIGDPPPCEHTRLRTGKSEIGAERVRSLKWLDLGDPLVARSFDVIEREPVPALIDVIEREPVPALNAESRLSVRIRRRLRRGNPAGAAPRPSDPARGGEPVRYV